ncbi:hypothetical protein KKF61_02040 [Patescibacteria group bacterium]|nr:hypothetical protein [Patescibacteria group bacterium]
MRICRSFRKLTRTLIQGDNVMKKFLALCALCLRSEKALDRMRNLVLIWWGAVWIIIGAVKVMWAWCMPGSTLPHLYILALGIVMTLAVVIAAVFHGLILIEAQRLHSEMVTDPQVI